MDAFDDLRNMEEAVKQLGDEPPTPEDLKKVEDDAAKAAESDDYDIQEDLSGGLAGTQDDEDEKTFDVEDLLGISKPEPKAEAAEQEEPQQEPSVDREEVQAPSGPSSLEERVKELSDRLKLAEEQNAMLIKRQLGGEVEEAEPESEVELEDDVEDYLKPYVEKMVASRLEELEKYVKPVKDQQERELVASEISKHPGFENFEAKHVQLLEEGFKSIPEEERSLYQQGGMAGAILLAQRLNSEGKLGLAKPRSKPSAMANRHHSESTSRGFEGTDENNEQELARRLKNMPTDEFLRRLEAGGFE